MPQHEPLFNESGIRHSPNRKILVSDDGSNWDVDQHSQPVQQEGREVPDGWTVQHARSDAGIPDGLTKFRISFEMLEHLIGLQGNCTLVNVEVNAEDGVVDFSAEVPGFQGRGTPLFGRIQEERIVIGRFEQTEM